jgi:hypothetical protein
MMSPGAKTSGAPAAHFPDQHGGTSARIGVRASGGQPGNRNRWIHGRRSAGATARRKSGAAGRKAAGLILARLDLLNGYRHRPRPLREDQRQHLGTEALTMLQRLGLVNA